jgi:TolB-like protein
VALLYRPSWLRRNSTSIRPAVERAPIASRRAVAVLGFRNLSGGKEDAWFSTALSEMPSTELAAGGTLRLVSGEDVARVKSELAWQDAGSLANDTLLRIHQNLGSDLLVVGAYAAIGRKGNKQIRVDLRLQNAYHRVSEPCTGSRYSISVSATNQTGFEMVLPDFLPITLILIWR